MHIVRLEESLMGKTITQKIIESHLLSGIYVPGSEIGIKIDQTLVQDATGTLAYLQFEAMKVSSTKTELSVTYVDHNTIQIGFENADDHRYLQSMSRKYGIYQSRAGNGICHQVHLERFGKPGKTLLGADSHTPTCGSLVMIAIGAGGLDIALAMGGQPFYLTCPKVIKINLTGRLQPWVTAKDVILKVLEIFTAKGNVGFVFEYGGPGLENLTVPERATITNMGAECGVTTSVFPSDEITLQFLKAQQRAGDWVEIKADSDAEYESVIELDLSEIVPMTAAPHSPQNVTTVRDVGDIGVQQVCMGSCTNSSYKDLATAARILKGKVVHPEVSFVIAPGSKQALENLSRDGYLTDLISAGARIAECACGFCIGNSQSPSSGAVSLRTSNRNFLGRSGTRDAKIYLVSPITAAAAVITGKLIDPRDLGMEYPDIAMPERFYVDDRMIIKPEDTADHEKIDIVRGPNIGVPPSNEPFPKKISGVVSIKVGDHITTDHIMPAGARLKYRPNIPKYAGFVFEGVDSEFSTRAAAIRDAGDQNIIVGGVSYGQGSSREHAAICPMYLGVKAIITKSFERIHEANLINFGILPLTFDDDAIYDAIDMDDRFEIDDIWETIDTGVPLTVNNMTKGTKFTAIYSLTERQKQMLFAGGALNYLH